MGDDETATAGRITGLIGVYDADHTIRGEVAYWVGARLGRRHCALCDITHGSVRQRPEWRQCRDGLPVPFDTYHRDDQPPEVSAALSGTAPAVVATTTSGDLVALLGPDELEACHGSPDRLVEAISAAAAHAGLTWPTP